MTATDGAAADIATILKEMSLSLFRESVEIMWNVKSAELLPLRTPGGAHFAEFINALLTAHAFSHGLPASEIETNPQTNVGDSGVDAKVRRAVPDDEVGWMDVPTCWQFKATQARSVSPCALRTEIQKPYASRLVQEGYGYRLCICDDITQKKRHDWEQILAEEANKLNPSAPPPRVLSADDLARWASRFPALIVRFFRPALEEVFHLAAWGRSITADTPTYVEDDSWPTMAGQIREHADLTRKRNSIVLPIQGEAGVGKTRLVFEALSRTPGALGMVVYTANEEIALRIATALATDSSLSAVLVADECSLPSRFKLETILRGHAHRARVIAIDTSGEGVGYDAGEIWLSRLADSTVDRILSQNFPGVASDRRRAYVRLSGGFVRLAADLCQRDDHIAPSGGLEGALGGVSGYYLRRLADDERQVIEAIGLFWKVGYKNEVREEWQQTCALLGLNSSQAVRLINTRLKDSPGFVAQAGRYFYVTPAIIAPVAFQEAWRRWIQHDPGAFFQELPALLVQPFLKRVSANGSPEARKQVGAFFRRWFIELRPLDLPDAEVMERVATVVESAPGEYLPLLRSLIESVPPDVLVLISGTADRGWGPRRTLVWLAEWLAAFPEYFADTEAILLRLALAESEPGIGNNATGIWQQLFRIFLSGTAAPFAERIQVLEKRVFSGDRTQFLLGIQALERLYDEHSHRTLGPPVVAGRVPPPEWAPRTSAEWKLSLKQGLDILTRAANIQDEGLRLLALEVLIGKTVFLLREGFLKELKDLSRSVELPQVLLPRLIEGIEDFLRYQTTDADGNTVVQQEYVAAVNSWLDSLRPSDLHGRLVTVVGKDPWHHLDEADQQAWKQEMADLAQRLCSSQADLQAEIAWLCCAEARSAARFGEELGKLDAATLCFPAILEATLKTQAAGMARGYLHGLLANHPEHGSVVNDWIDRVEAGAPRIAYDLSITLGEKVHSVERAVRLVRSDALPPVFLRSFVFEAARRELSLEQFHSLLATLIDPIENGDDDAAQAAVEMSAAFLRTRHDAESFVSPEVQTLLWRMLEASAERDTRAGREWADVLRDLAGADPARAARLASLALAGDGYEQRKYAEGLLAELAQQYPEPVMTQLGAVMLDEERGWHFLMGKYGSLATSLPVHVVKAWLDSAGTAGARRLARHLPAPYLDPEGKPVVPEITALVLSVFEEDDETFASFFAGVHSYQIYTGDIAAEHDREAKVATQFLSHPLRRIREWARLELQSAEENAVQERQREEEWRIDDLQ